MVKEGANIILLARSEGKLQQLADNLPHETKTKIVFQDLSDTEGLKLKVNALLEELGPIEILVNNAGGPKSGPILEASPEDFMSAFQTHVIASQTLAQLLVPGMKEKNYGRIINIISTSVKVPIPNLGVSNTIRGAMASWSKTLANEVGQYGITVNNVLPGFTATERLDNLMEAAGTRLGKSPQAIEQMWLNTIPAKRFARPEETAQAIAFLASPAASYINGINLPVDGGRTGSL